MGVGSRSMNTIKHKTNSRLITHLVENLKSFFCQIVNTSDDKEYSNHSVEGVIILETNFYQ